MEMSKALLAIFLYCLNLQCSSASESNIAYLDFLKSLNIIYIRIKVNSLRTMPLIK